MSDVGILWFIMSLQLVGTNVSVCDLGFCNGLLDQQGMFLSFDFDFFFLSFFLILSLQQGEKRI